jgi:ADP-ribose pyrophosphatase
MQLASRRIHTGKVISLDVDQVRFPDGSSGELEIVRHPGAAAIVPVASDLDSADPTLLMIRQYRYAIGGELWEIPAGRLANPQEDPEACARRELEEEVGVKAGTVRRLTTVWTTPGFTDEAIHLFVATDLTATAHSREPDEFIDVVPRALSEVLEMIGRGEICDAKTVVGILYMAGYILGQ